MTELHVYKEAEGKELAAIGAKILLVMKDVAGVPKNGWNDFHKYAFVQEADLKDAVRKSMVQHGLALITKLRKHKLVEWHPTHGGKPQKMSKAYFDFTLVDTTTGATVTIPWEGIAVDGEDKSLWKAMTGAVKYFLFETFLVPAGNDPENTGNSQEQVGSASGGNQQRAKAAPAAKPAPKPKPKMTKAQADLFKLISESTGVTKIGTAVDVAIYFSGDPDLTVLEEFKGRVATRTATALKHTLKIIKEQGLESKDVITWLIKTKIPMERASDINQGVSLYVDTMNIQKEQDEVAKKEEES